jgi:hypothetical protein
MTGPPGQDIHDGTTRIGPPEQDNQDTIIRGRVHKHEFAENLEIFLQTPFIDMSSPSAINL